MFINNASKLVAVILTMFVIFTNSASIVLANPAINESVSTDTQATKQPILTLVLPYYLADGKMQGPEWLKTTSANFSFTQDHKPNFSLETIQPFSQATKQGQLWFWQGRYARQSDTHTTANLGFGWRKLSADKNSVLGFNVFYDYGFQYNLSRIGVGAEYFNKLMEYRANVYLPVSGERLTDGSSTYIRAVRGMDYEIGSSFEGAPWLSFHVMGFYYDNHYTDQYKGYRIRGNMQLTPRINLETGFIKANRQNGDLYVKAVYNLADAFGPAPHGGKEMVSQATDLSAKLLQKVRRDNEIRTETRTETSSPAIQTGSAIITVIIDNGVFGTSPASGETVSVSVNGSTQTATTDASGQATFSNLPVGDYTFTAGGQSTTVTVTAGTTATGTITMYW